VIPVSELAEDLLEVSAIPVSQESSSVPIMFIFCEKWVAENLLEVSVIPVS
jgi:hypothetical protein